MIISTCLLDQMQANSSGVEPYPSSEEKDLSCLVYIVHETFNQAFPHQWCSEGKEMYSKSVLLMQSSCFAVSTYCFFDVLGAVVVVAS